MNKSEYSISAGQAFFIPGGITADYFADAYDPWEYLWIGYNGNMAALFNEQAGFSIDNPVHQLHDRTEEFEEMMEEIPVYTTISSSDELYRIGWLYRMLALFTNVSSLASAKTAYNPGKLTKEYIVDNAVTYMKENYNTVTVTETAARLKINRSHLFNVFKEIYGISPKKFIMNLRFEHARELLETTNLPVKQIAADTGFGDSPNFSRQFKMQMNMAPRIYRSSGERREDYGK